MLVLQRLTAAAAIAQLGERQTEDLEVPGSIPGLGILKSFMQKAHCVKASFTLFKSLGLWPNGKAFHSN